MLQARMRLSMKAHRGEVYFDQPALPDFLRTVQIRNLPVGAQRVDVELERLGDDVSVHLLRRAPGIRVITIQ